MTFAVFLKRIIFGGIVAILLLPLLPNAGHLLYPLGRDVIFRILTEFLFVAYVLLALRNRQFLPRMSGIFIALAAFAAVQGIAAFTGPQPSLSFWGDPLRNTGVFSQLHLLAFFIIATSVLTTLRSWKIILWTITGVAAFVSLFAVAQALFSDVSRAFGTLGNPNFLGAWILLALFLAGSLALSEQSTKLRLAAFSAVLLAIAALFFTFSRGAYLGLFGGGLFFLFFLPRRAVSERMKILARNGALALLLAAAALPLLARLPQTESLLGKTPNLKRILKTSIEDPTAKTRLESWHAALKGIQERPLLGFGPENFSIPFDAYYTGALEHLPFPETWADRAHNVFLDVAVSSGLLGLAAFIAIYIVAFARLFSARKKGGAQGALIAHALTATFIASLIQNSFNLDTPISLVYLYFLFALSHSLTQFEKDTSLPSSKNFKFQNSNSKFKTSKKNLVIRSWFLGAGGVILFLFSLVFHANLLAANYHMNKGEALYGKGKLAEAMKEYDKGLANKTPVSHLIHHKYGSTILLLLSENPSIAGKEAEPLLEKGFAHVEETLRERPFYTRTLMLGGLLATTGYEIYSRAQENDRAEELRGAANDYFTRSLELSPRRSSILKSWALLDIAAKNFTQAKEKLYKALEINAGAREARWLLATTYLREGNVTQFEKLFQEAAMNDPAIENEQNLLLAADICFREIQNFACAATYYEMLAERFPHEIRYKTSAALAYKNAGKRDKARKAAEEALRETQDPQLRQSILQFLRSL